ncbi:peptidylprolyl isomerase, partial [Myxococcota bacterium]
RRAEAAVFAQALVEQLAEQARAAGPITDAEITQATERRWLEFNRPPAARTVHAVVRVKEPEQDAAARALAERLAQTLSGIRGAPEFLEKARSVPAGELDVRAEQLPPMAADGREVNPDSLRGHAANFDTTYARAANALVQVGDQSPVIRSAFGYHVVLLTEKVSERRVPLAERRQALSDDVLRERLKALLESSLARLRAMEPVSIPRTALRLTAEATLVP